MNPQSNTKAGRMIFVAGGAGFIGSHLVHWLLKNRDSIETVTVFDNFSSGQERHLADIKDDRRLKIIRGDIKNFDILVKSMQGHDEVFHFASNPDIAKAIIQPSIDFWEGTFLTQNIVESMRVNSIQKIFYASGSGIYGETGYQDIPEDYGPLLPISTYGASKLAGETLICSYCHLFGMIGRAYRFANVVGARQTHGVAYDFIRKLREDPTNLTILGDGTQSKSYIFINDIINAIMHADKFSNKNFDYFNVATGDYITVRQIADLVVEEMGLKNVKYIFTGGDRGWKGDVPVVRFDLSKIYSLGWQAELNSSEAMKQSIRLMLQDRNYDDFVK
jgi:UDP-glucose 4-epimerase